MVSCIRIEHGSKSESEKKKSDCKKVSEGGGKEGLVGLTKAIALELNMEVKVKVKKRKVTVKKCQKVVQKKG